MVRKERRRALREALEDLRRYRTTYSAEEFLVGRDPQRLVLQALYTAVQACLDEALEICRSAGIDTGETYRDAFLALGRAGIIEAELSVRMADWASFRNVLAHFYPVIDFGKVWSALDQTADLEAFCAWIENRRP